MLFSSSSSSSSSFFSFFLNRLALLASCGVVVATSESVLRIRTASEFIDFSNSVNNGTANYTGTTVLLDSDINFSDELSQQFSPIGEDIDKCFNGTFDGQGHVIRNLAIDSSLGYVGLFGYSRGLTIKNVVISSSCSIVNSYSSGNVHTGGIIGSCYSREKPLIIENSVNMANITYNGKSSSVFSLFLGGIAGYTYLTYNFTARNCVNYGTIVNSGDDIKSYIGGIAGFSTRPSGSNRLFIQNCLNYGTIVYNVTKTYHGSIYIGGIAGDGDYISIENCVSAGAITSSQTTDVYIGAINGYAKYSSTSIIAHSFWTSSVGHTNATGSVTSTMDNESSLVDLSSEFVGKMNAYSASKSWNKWLHNRNTAVVSFKVNKREGISLNSLFILLPDLAESGNEGAFSGWFNDENLTSPFTSNEVTSATTLYGMLCASNYTVVLDVNGGEPSSIQLVHPMTVECNGVYGTLPTPTRTGHTFRGWFTEHAGGNKVESGGNVSKRSNHTLYAHWSPNEYTVTLDPNGGNLSVSEITVTFNAPYESLPVPNRSGYIFLGWATEDDESVTNEATVRTSGDHTLYAKWTEIRAGHVEIVFGKKDMSEEEIKGIIEEYTDREYRIIKIEDGESSTIVIVEFIDITSAESFVEIINGSSEGTTQIRKAGFILEHPLSISSRPIYPIFLFMFFIVLVL